MLSKKEQHALRSNLFRHLDGIGTTPTAFALHEKGVLRYLLDKKEVPLEELTSTFSANEGYLNVALRILCSQGWLKQALDNKTDTIQYGITDISEFAFEHVHLYKDVVHLLKFSEQFHPRKFQVEPFRVLEGIFKNFKEDYGIKFSQDEKEQIVQKQILKHIEGVIVGPTVVHLGMSGMFHKYFMEARFKPEEFHKDPDSFRRLLDIFAHLGWFLEKNETYEFTEKGLFYAKRASAYGVTVSYIPTFRKLDELIFGNPTILKEAGKEGPEKHVDRAMNVWGSGGAHSGYFKVVDEIIVELFNKPIEEQPKGILDMGCGNGAFIQHLFDVIEQQTLRGKMLEEYPLILVGADYNETALKITKANLIQADIWAKVIWGDIGRPDLLAQDLQERYGVELVDLLNVRTFLDHNRIWEAPKHINKSRISNSTGAFAFEGRRINNNLVEDSLLEHFRKWAPFVSKFGLLVIELHTVPPELVANNLGRTAATAYDATHGYSDQYIVEVDVFTKIMAEAGLYPDQEKFKKFPNSDLATVTINLFKGTN
ncbi:class I SAM-dependent methyltransferase [Fulvivirgaceae bacterium BMA10]|uniref:Class I SAM-dependent methyltransferase n=1 Tax=Splendidivirga corallicola TaxID=3051826 RepID=A0ABT8KMJ2_9BACT|nr:class I SAM-dependent methyltransferase [Fulvivirgaceae bacterium BMA10]